MVKKTSSPRKSSAPRLKAVKKNCPFCKEKKEPDYKNIDVLPQYMTDRARIIGKARSGLCAKHQKRLARAIKRARFLGLLPFTPSL